ncbi:MAG TPA: CehA/McbA family metallohydrolase [Steroidobacteraceae bacterium]|nr:CehA/McbA family metallohydrolase [Steroidobacteraceae bacterium]
MSRTTRAAARCVAALALVAAAAALAERQPVLKQIDLPHSYYYREMYLPQLTSGPSSVAFSPDGASLVYSMAGSLWRQQIGSDRAIELTSGPGYDYQPDWSPDGRRIAFVRHDQNAIELWQLDVESGAAQQLTASNAVNLEPRYSPDGKRLAYVSTDGSGHFNLFVAPLDIKGLGTPRTVVAPRESKIARYYYSTHDHTINPSWTPDGKRLVFVTNREIAYGTGDLCSAAVDDPADFKCFVHEETSWRARPEVAPDGRRVLYSSYQGRQWHQLWLTTLAGDATLPLTFGDFDATQARWSPDGRRIAYIENETGNLTLRVRDAVSATSTVIAVRERQYQRPMGKLHIVLQSSAGQRVSGRVSVLGADWRYYAPDDAWVHADDGFDPQRQPSELRYFHCYNDCTVTVPAGEIELVAWRGQESTPVQQRLNVGAGATTEAALTLRELTLPAWAPRAVSADLHVHMNYGGHYRNTERSLIQQARAEDLDVIHNLIVNKEQRIPDIATFRTEPTTGEATIISGQEYHTSYWGHLGLLFPKGYVTPDFSAYQHSALTSPYPHNGVIADLIHQQGGLVGYVHPFDTVPVPEREVLTNALPADVALGKTDYVEVVGFSDHKATAEVWYKLLNLGFRVPAGAGTDAMANYASLRGPVGMNRVYLNTGGSVTPQALHAALKEGRTVASNGPQLALDIDGKAPGDTLTLPAGEHAVRYRAALRSPVAVDHFEIVQNGRVVARHRLSQARTQADVAGTLKLNGSGWIVARAWNDRSDPLILDLYPYATTSPVYVSIGGQPANSPADAQYFVHWLDRTIASAEGRTDYNDERERQATLAYLRAAQAVYAEKARQQ